MHFLEQKTTKDLINSLLMFQDLFVLVGNQFALEMMCTKYSLFIELLFLAGV